MFYVLHLHRLRNCLLCSCGGAASCSQDGAGEDPEAGRPSCTHWYFSTDVRNRRHFVFTEFSQALAAGRRCSAFKRDLLSSNLLHNSCVCACQAPGGRRARWFRCTVRAMPWAPQPGLGDRAGAAPQREPGSYGFTSTYAFLWSK